MVVVEGKVAEEEEVAEEGIIKMEIMMIVLKPLL
jgi:hypothetical protein